MSLQVMRSLLLYLLAASLVAARPQKEALCSYGTSNYSLSWTFDELSNDVVFRLTATSAAKNFWTGVYFGEEEPVSKYIYPLCLPKNFPNS